MSATAPHVAPQPDQKVWEALISQQAVTHRTLALHEQLMELIAQLETPARMEPIQLTANQNPVESGAISVPTLSVGLYNPTGSLGAVNLGIIGSAGAADAIVVPVGKLIILPISARVIEVGTGAAIGAGQSLYCYLLRFRSVQPAYLGG